jgi:predicted PurR-regulated permease PerM
MQKTFLGKSIQIMLFVLLLGGILYIGKPLFMPLAIAGMLALVFVPCANWLERKGWKRTPASIACGLLLLLVIGGMLTLLVWRIRHIDADISDIRSNFSHMTDRIHGYFREELKMDKAAEKKILPIPTPDDGIGKTATLVMGGLITLIVYLVLTWFYTVTLLILRHRFKEFVLKLVPDDRRSVTKMILLRSVHVVQQYLSGLAIVIVCLWVMYGIGFSLIGIRNALFFAVLCGLLEIVPFVGNITGVTLTSLMALSQGGGFTMVGEVLGVYALIQSMQFYIIAPLVMRAQLNINPLFIILVLIGGDIIWGITGMILAITLLGIARIVFEQVDSLHPLAYITGQDETKKRTSWLKRLRDKMRGQEEAAADGENIPEKLPGGTLPGSTLPGEA